MYLSISFADVSFIPVVIFLFDLQVIKKEIKLLGFNSIYYFEFGKDFVHTPEKHNFWEMVYVDKGEIIAVSDGIGKPLTSGEAVFHEPGEIHAHISNKEVANNMLVISFCADGEKMVFFRKKTFMLDKTSKTLLSLFVKEAENALEVIPNKYEDKRNLDFSRSKFGATQLLECYFTEFLINLIRNGSDFSDKILSTEKSRAIGENSIVELITKYLEDNVYNSIDLNDVCRKFYLGKSQLSCIFKAQTGKSVIEYYRYLKFTEAKKLLREKNFSVSQIADKLGYSSVHNFSRAFGKLSGFSPTEYSESIL